MYLMGKRFKELREDAEKSRKELASYLGMDVSNYGKYERGEIEPSIHVIIKLAKFYNVTADYLLGLSDDYSPTGK